MTDSSGVSASSQSLVEALARDALPLEERRRAEQLLEQSQALREFYRGLTGSRFPEIPNYTIIGQVGKGGFGVVYKAIHHAKERVEALKVLFSKTPLLTSYFENEVHLIAKLRHPNIATLFEAQLASPPLFYTMEFVEGQRLNEYIKHHEVSLAQRVELIRAVALALDYAHRQGVVHRDIKPQNILIDDQGQPHIVDFGIAKRLGLAESAPTSEAGREGAIGTLGYIAPEQVNRGATDARADVFALGALLFHCVTGEPARYARDPARVQSLLRERRVSEPEGLAAIIGRCVAESPEQRYPSARAFSDDLDNYVSGRQTAAQGRPSLWRRGTRVASLVLRRYPLAVRFAALAALVALLTPVYDAAGMRIDTGGETPDQTILIGFTEKTEEAIKSGRLGKDIPGIGLDVGARYSLRALHGQLLKRLARSEARVVAFDLYFPKCTDWDDAFVEGVQAMQPIPVFIGADSFDINGIPRCCPKIRDSVRGVGSLVAVNPDMARGQYEYVSAVMRGFEEPIPALTTLAYGGFRFADSDLALKVVETEDPARVEIRYRKRAVGNSDEQRFRTQFDSLPVERLQRVSEDASWTPASLFGQTPSLRPGDIAVHGRVPARSNEYWRRNTIEYADVFTASDDELRSWFGGKAVVIGQMVPGKDQFRGALGESVFGCQVHADVLNHLLGPRAVAQLAEHAVAWRILFWSALGAVVVVLLPLPSARAVTSTLLGCAALSLGCIVLGFWIAFEASARWSVELGVGLSVFVAALALAYALRFLGERQTLLAPAAITLATEDASTTLASTMPAQPQR